MDDLLVLEGIRKSYNIGTPAETEVLHGVDMTVRRGEFVALMGPSGSGKSTLLNIIGLLDRPTSGLLAIDGQETTHLSEAALTRLRGHSIGFVFQYHYLISAFTARENIIMPMLVDRDSVAIVRAILGLASALGMTTTAEGVESEQLVETLTALGCDVAQGYYFARPLPSDRAYAYWRERRL